MQNDNGTNAPHHTTPHTLNHKVGNNFFLTPPIPPTGMGCQKTTEWAVGPRQRPRKQNNEKNKSETCGRSYRTLYNRNL